MFSYYFKKAIYRTLAFISPELFLKIQFRRLIGRWPDLKNPKTYNEKINWLKLYYHDPLLTRCSDKYEVRDYLKEKGFSEYLNEVYGVWSNVDDIDFKSLPEKFVLKSTHGSAQTIICRDKSNLDWEKTKQKMNNWLKTNLYYFGLEWCYKNITPRIICEKLIETGDERLPNDLKILCFNGKPSFIYLLSNRKYNGKGAFLDCYDCDWNLQELVHGYPNSKKKTEPPKELPVLCDIAKKISQDFPFVRVDFYLENGQILIGELTFYSGDGFVKFHPEGADEKLGSYLSLPQKRL